MSDRTLRRLRVLGWFLFAVGVVVFLVGTDEASGRWMGANLALSVIGGVLAGLRYAFRGREGDDSPGRRPR